MERPAKDRYFSKHLQQPKTLIRGKRVTDQRVIAMEIRQSIMKTFSALGSWEGMLAWAQDSPDLFYGHLLPKLLPRDLDSQGVKGVQVIVQYGADVKPKPLVIPSATAGDASKQSTEATEQAMAIHTVELRSKQA